MIKRLMAGVVVLGIVFGFLSLPSMTCAQSENEIKLIIPFPPGGGGDTLGRTTLDLLSDNYGKTIWVANRPGAGGNIGIAQLISEKQDGKVFGYVTNGIMCVNQSLYDNMTFDPIRDLIPVGQLSKIGLVLVLNEKALPGVSDFKSLIKYAKEHPKEVFFASSGVGTTSHLAGEFLAQQLDLELTHVPHAGGAAAIVEVLAGRIPFMIDVAPNVISHVEKGTLKALAVTTTERMENFKNVPTMLELGVKDYVLYAWDGYVFAKGSPQEAVNKMSESIAALKNNPAAIARIKARGAEPVFSSAEEFAKYVREEQPKWKTLADKIRAQNQEK